VATTIPTWFSCKKRNRKPIPVLGATWEQLKGLVLAENELSAAQTTTWIFLADPSPQFASRGQGFESPHVHQMIRLQIQRLDQSCASGARDFVQQFSAGAD